MNRKEREPGKEGSYPVSGEHGDQTQRFKREQILKKRREKKVFVAACQCNGGGAGAAVKESIRAEIKRRRFMSPLLYFTILELRGVILF